MAEQKEEKQETDAARKRSPNFPYSSVRDCVRYITRLHGEVQTRKLPVFVAFGHMGLSPKSSSTDRIRAALSNYGLTKEETVNKEKHLQLTNLAYQIVIDTRESKRLARLREAALNDPMMKKIWESEWKRGLPNNDAEIISTLRADYKFQEEAARRFTTVLKDNYDFCQLATYYELPEGEPEKEVTPPPPANNGNPLIPPTPPSPPTGFEEYTLTLSKTKEVKLYTSDSLTKDDVDFMIMWIKRLDLERSSAESNKEGTNA
jgi:hypothetical protein